MENTKQVIVIRKDLSMRKGKMCAQVAHSSMAFLTKKMFIDGDFTRLDVSYADHDWAHYNSGGHREWEEINHWLKNSFRKICVYVNSEQELDEIHKKALDAGLISHIVVDNGATEFHGVPTKTVLSIGPHFDSKFIGITDHLPLL